MVVPLGVSPLLSFFLQTLQILAFWDDSFLRQYSPSVLGGRTRTWLSHSNWWHDLCGTACLAQRSVTTQVYSGNSYTFSNRVLQSGTLRHHFFCCNPRRVEEDIRTLYFGPPPLHDRILNDGSKQSYKFKTDNAAMTVFSLSAFLSIH